MKTVFTLVCIRQTTGGKMDSSTTDFEELKVAKAALETTARLLQQAGFRVTDNCRYSVDLSHEVNGSPFGETASIRVVTRDI